MEFLSPFLWRAPPLEMRRECREFFPDHAGKGSLRLTKEAETGPQGKSRGPPGVITWAPWGNHVGPQGQSRGPAVEITWAPWGNHMGHLWQSRGPPGEITWAHGGNHVGLTFTTSVSYTTVTRQVCELFNSFFPNETISCKQAKICQKCRN